MYAANLETSRLKLVLQTPDDIQSFIDGLPPDERAELSDDWLAMVNSASAADPWVHGFRMVRLSDDATIGHTGFKGPPSTDGVVEIAYGVADEFQNNGYATEAATALVDYAFSQDNVRLVQAHTLPESNASTRVLTKCGFQNVGEFVDPDDGPVWRWETTCKS